jgi:hypothetical protein
MTRTPSGKTVVSAMVTRDERRQLERRAAEGYRSLSSEIRRAIAEHLARQAEHDERGDGDRG